MSTPTVAGPRLPYSSSTYTGAELAVQPTRQGATDAARIPSLFNGRRVDPAQLKAAITAEPESYQPPAPMARIASSARYVSTTGAVDAIPNSGQRFHAIPLPEKKRRTDTPRPERALTKLRELKPSKRQHEKPYGPRPTSAPGKVLEHLRTHGGFMTFAEVDMNFDTKPATRTALFRPAITAGLLTRVVVNRQPAYALPSFVPPPEPPPPEKKPKGPTDNQIKRLEAGIRRWAARIEKLTQASNHAAAKMGELQRALEKHKPPKAVE